ncbi:MAG: hypothetical protein KatS3mg105_2320 [Gemmatales bacterium]|nr:MAG: hypothetical protein KatS3mg105_2320 [Gemmatales bacterium]
MIVRLLSACLCASMLCLPAASLAKEKVFRAGAATSNITPPLGSPIVGGFRVPYATHIHDELHARCLVLDDGTTRIAIVLCDNVGIPREVYDAAKEKVFQATKIPVTHQLMAATHTHSGPSARNPNKMVRTPKLTAYQEFLVQRIADGVQRAVNQLEPARIGWGKVDVPQHVFNRRWLVRNEKEARNPFGGTDKVRMNPTAAADFLIRPAGPVDPEVAFVSLQSRDGRPIALLANYSLHYVGGVPRGHISADYFALFADRIQQLLGADRLDPPFVGILSNGTSGDVNNIDFRKPRERMAPYQKMKIVANDVADAVFRAHKKITFHDWVPLSAKATDLTLAVRKATEQQIAYAKKVLEKRGETGWHPRETFYAERILRHARESPDKMPIPLQALRLGNLGISAIPFEVFAETGLELKKKSPFKQTFTIELANGSFGYLPTPRHYPLGGYETWLGTSFMETEASTKIAKMLLEMHKELHSEAPE